MNWRLLLFFSLSVGFSQSAGVFGQDKASKFEETLKNVVNEQLKGLRDDIDYGAKKVGDNGTFMTSIDLIQFRNLDQFVLDRIQNRKDAIKAVIWATALEIEKGEDFEVLVDDGLLSITNKQKEDIQKLRSSISDMNVSINSLSLAIKILVDLSSGLYQEANAEIEPGRKRKLYIEYTSFVYELSSIVIEILEGFDHKGRREIEELYKDRKRHVDGLNGRIDNRRTLMKNRLDNSKITKAVYDQKITMLNASEQALKATLDGWQEIFSIISKQSEWSKSVLSKKYVFEDLRDESGLQLDILSEISIAAEVLKALKDITEITEAANVPLLRLDGEIARQLMGLDKFSVLSD